MCNYLKQTRSFLFYIYLNNVKLDSIIIIFTIITICLTTFPDFSFRFYQYHGCAYNPLTVEVRLSYVRSDQVKSES